MPCVMVAQVLNADDLITLASDWRNAALLGGGVVALWLLLRIRRAIRARRPARIHPKLAPYMMNDPALLAQRRAEAAGIVATSSTDRVAGYEIVQQIEAVFEDGHRSPADAIESLKASAARRGANALINLAQQRTAAGRCTAQGDAVVIRPIIPKSIVPPEPPPLMEGEVH